MRCVRPWVMAWLALSGCACPDTAPPPFPEGAAMTVLWDEVVEGLPFTRCEGFPPTTRPDQCIRGSVRADAATGWGRVHTPLMYEAYRYELDIDGDRARLCRIYTPTDLLAETCPETDWRCATAGEVRIGADLVSIHAELAGATVDALLPRAVP